MKKLSELIKEMDPNKIGIKVEDMEKRFGEVFTKALKVAEKAPGSISKILNRDKILIDAGYIHLAVHYLNGEKNDGDNPSKQDVIQYFQDKLDETI